MKIECIVDEAGCYSDLIARGQQRQLRSGGRVYLQQIDSSESSTGC